MWLIYFQSSLLDNKPLNDEVNFNGRGDTYESPYDGQCIEIKTREAKDRYIDSNFKNTLSELTSDASAYGTENSNEKADFALTSLST